MKASKRKQQRLMPEDTGCFWYMFFLSPKLGCVTDAVNITSDKKCTGHRYPELLIMLA